MLLLNLLFNLIWVVNSTLSLFNVKQVEITCKVNLILSSNKQNNNKPDTNVTNLVRNAWKSSSECF